MTTRVIAVSNYLFGLGNRVRLVLGAKALADTEHREFAYVWPIGPKFGPKLTDLWHFDAPTLSTARSRVCALRYGYLNQNVTEWLDEDRRAERIWQIRTGHALVVPQRIPSWTIGLRRLQPVSPVSDRVRQCYDGDLAVTPYIGVMIRAHSASHVKTRAHSPVEWYLERMREIRRDHPNTPFFLSCDVPAVQQRVADEIGNCFGQDDKGSYNSVDGIQASVADLYLLASAQYILAPYFSSFPELAVHLSGDRVGLETSMAPSPVPLELSAARPILDPLAPHRRD